MLEKVPTNDEVRNLMQVDGEELVEGRYLLFDSGCGECTETAASVEKEAGNWLSARPLNDHNVRELLTEANPDWKWEPTLLEVNGAKVRSYTGLSMKAKIVAGIGPKRAFSVAKIARKATSKRNSEAFELTLAPSKDDPNRKVLESARRVDRRTALKLGAMSLAGAMIPFLPQKASAQVNDGRTRVYVVKFGSARALRTYAQFRQYPKVARIHTRLVNQGFRIVRSQAEGATSTAVASNGTATGGTVLVGIQYRNGARTAVVNIRQTGAQANGGATPGQIFAEYAISTNAGNGANIWRSTNNGFQLAFSLPNLQREYRLATGRNHPGAGARNASSTTDTRQAAANGCFFESPYTGYCFSQCALCELLFNATVTAACGATAAWAVSVTGVAIVACGVAAVPCVVLAGILAAAGCSFLDQYFGAGQTYCAEQLGVC